MRPKKVIHNKVSSSDFTGLLELIDEVSNIYEKEEISYEYDMYTNGICFFAKFKIYG